MTDRYIAMNRAELAALYIEQIGYDPFEDDPTLTVEQCRAIFREYDEEAARESRS